jgi:tRNA(fMet)-specific endonuclease VapC
MKQALVDTDTIPYFFRNHTAVVSKLEEYLQEQGFVYLSVVTYYEVLNGLFYKDSRKQSEKFEEFVSLNQVLPLSPEIARKAARTFADLRKNGLTLGHNNVLIASTALLFDLTLISNNTAHFSRIRGLVIYNWAM